MCFAGAVLLLACSGPCVAFAMLRATWVGWTVAALTALFAAAVAWNALRQRRFGRAALVCVLAALHPGWWMSAYWGDCGSLLSLSVGTVSAVLVGYFVARSLLGSRSTPIRRLAVMGAFALAFALTFAVIVIVPFLVRGPAWSRCLEQADRAKGCLYVGSCEPSLW